MAAFWQRLQGGGRRRLAACALMLCALTAAPAAWAERLALIVGNGDYANAPDLTNPVGDAQAVAEALKGLDFKVTVLTDAGGKSLWAEMDDFVAKAEGAESVVFYYAGHAFQMNGVNYLVPVDAALKDREGLGAETWNLDAIIARLQSRSRQTLIFLDACRNDPLPQAVRGSGAASDGLARVQTGLGTFVAFATAPGGVAADAVADAKHSPFTTALLTHLGDKGKSISDLMIEVRNDVETATLRKQVPWDQSSLREQFYFVPPEAAAKQELSEADFELLAQLSPEDRRAFLDLLAQSGFDEASLQAADAEIALAEANLQAVAEESTIIEPLGDSVEIGAPTELAEAEVPAETLPEAAADGGDVLLGDLAQADDSVIIGEVPGAAEVAELDPALKPDEETGEAPIRLAALDWTVRGLDLTAADQRPRLQGHEVTADTEEGRALLAAIDPRLLEEPATPGLPEDLALAVQGELKRVGCYRMAVDGNWGKGSRTALTSYYLAKHVVPTSLEPTAELYTRLTAETKVVCEVRVASSAVKTGNRAKVETQAEVTNDVKSTKKTGKKQETAKTRITKGTIGITGSF